MREMGWNYAELMATPEDVVLDCWAYMQTEARYHQEQMKK